MEHDTPSPARLLAEAAFARRLALALTGDSAEAEDVVQEALASAVEREPVIQRTPRGWLAGTIRNLVRMRRRSEGRRRAREYRAAKPGTLPSAAETAARAELLERVARAVREIREPFRSTLIHRYYDDMPPREIANRTGVPVTTVKSRLRRGLAVLRAELDETAGGRARWTALLLPLARPRLPAVPSSLATGAAIMTLKKSLFAVSAVLLLFAGAAIWIGGTAETANPPPSPDPDAAGPTGTAAASADGAAVESRPDVPAGAPSTGADRGPRIRGRVEGPGGAPIAGAVLDVLPGSSPGDPAGGVFLRPVDSGFTGDDGAFDLRALPGGTLRVSHPAYRPLEVLAALLPPDGIVVLDPGLAITGRVAFPDDRPVPGVSVVGGRQSTRTGEDGRYRLSGLAPGPLEVSCQAAGSRKVAAGDTNIDFTVREHVLRIRARDESGRDLPDADLEVWWTSDGRRQGHAGDLDPEAGEILAIPRARVGLTVDAPGRAQAARLLDVAGKPRLHDIDLVLRAAPAPGELLLRVTRADGRPVRAGFVTLRNVAGGLVRGFLERPVDFDPEGTCRLPDVPPGVRFLEFAGTKPFRREGFLLPAEAEVTVRSGETTTVHIEIPVGGRVRVVVRDSAGEDLVPERLDLLDREGNRLHLSFLQDREAGGFTTRLVRPLPALCDRPVPPGLYRVRCRREGEVPVTSDPVPIHAGETSEVVLRVP